MCAEGSMLQTFCGALAWKSRERRQGIGCNGRRRVEQHVASDGGAPRLPQSKEEKVDDSNANDVSNADAEGDPESAMEEAVPSSANASQAFSDGDRVLMAFGVPAQWYGGIVKLSRTVDDRPDESSSDVYIAFDDGELRKFSKGEHVVHGVCAMRCSPVVYSYRCFWFDHVRCTCEWHR